MFAYSTPSILPNSGALINGPGVSRKRRREIDQDMVQIDSILEIPECLDERRKRVRQNNSHSTSLWYINSNKKLPRIIDSKEPYVCFKQHCKSHFITWNDMCLHVQEHHSEKCASCGELLICQAQIDHHRRIHEGPKGFVCGEDGCEKVFSTKEKLGMHFNFIHVYHRKHMCLHDDCGRAFAYKSVLERHELSHGPSKPCVDQTTRYPF